MTVIWKSDKKPSPLSLLKIVRTHGGRTAGEIAKMVFGRGGRGPNLSMGHSLADLFRQGLVELDPAETRVSFRRYIISKKGLEHLEVNEHGPKS